MKKVAIPLWSSSGRDFQIVMPIAYYLEKVKHYEVKLISVWDWYLVDKFKPDLILFANTEGAVINYTFVKYLKSKEYTVISLTSEGNFFEEFVENFLWGVNKDKILYEDKKFLWSQRCRNMVVKKHPELKQKMGVSGGVGFDRYKIYPFKSKKEVLQKYNKEEYDKVIGYAGWVFDLIRTEDEIKNFVDKSMIHEIERFKIWLAGHHSKYPGIKSNINNLIREIIKNNPDILFILKLHPGTIDDDNTEIQGLDFENVLVLKYEEEIADIINICDIWMAFDSTSTLEAWLLDKPTANLFPPPERIRAQNPIFNGSIVVEDCAVLQNYIDEFYVSGKIEDFENRESNRDDAIEQIIQWGDGLNHVRVGGEIAQMIEQQKELKISKDDIPTRIKLFGIHLMKKYSKYFMNMSMFGEMNFVLHQVSEKDIEKFKKEYYPYLDKFHGEVLNA